MNRQLRYTCLPVAARNIIWLKCLALTACVVGGLSPLRAENVVVVQQRDEKFQLLRNGEPYFIRGVGGDQNLELLASLGGNSIRTWGSENLATVLDEADRCGLTVCAGLWLGHEKHGFDYQNLHDVTRQIEHCLKTVRQHKDHPALLMWGIGNEMEGDGQNPAIWYAVNHIARECKRVDPNHPTMTVISELGENKLRCIEQFCPKIDVVGVNSYGGAPTLAERYRQAGVRKPYVLTEFGVNGPWEVAATGWGAPVEPSSSAKAKCYLRNYRKAVQEAEGACLGSYAFLWGAKQETTATWFGMLLPDGSRLGAADAMAVAWTGSRPANYCPVVASVQIDATDGLQPGQEIQASMSVHDPEGDPLSVSWELREDNLVVGTGGDAQAEQQLIEGVVREDGANATVTVPQWGGYYRLFAYVRDDKGGAAVANVPLRVDGPRRLTPSPKAVLPYSLYAEGSEDSVYAPSGYMGNTAAIRMTPDHGQDPHSGDRCLRVEYLASDQWGGVLWQSPPNDWEGAHPGGLDLTEAAALEFWARGAKGGEIVNFLVGGDRGSQPYHDTARAELKEARLTAAWQKQRIPLNGLDLTRIKTGFGWSVAGQGGPVTFFLDDVRFVAQ